MSDPPHRGVHPRKRFGQHFLHDRHALEQIAALCEVTPDERLLEIGPGTGNLTETLLRTPAKDIVAIERDRSLLPVLRERFAGERLQLVEGDAVHADFEALCPPDGRHVAVGNLPYNAGTEIYFRLLAHRTRIRRLVLMFQREVAERIVADAGSRSYGILSIMTALHGTSRIALRLAPGAFHPPPRVHSAVIVVDVDTHDRLDVAGDPRGFRRMVGGAFGARRKTLPNALTREGWTREQVCEALERLEISPKIRGEALSPEQLAALWRQLQGTALAGPETS